jgi:hypothetical protein
VSLLWRNHLRISLCPDRLVLGAYSRGLRSSRARSTLVPVQPAAAHAEDWRGALDALPGVLGSFRHHDVSVVIADQFVRYVLLPWNEALRSPDQWMSLARHRLAAVHGAAAADWDVKLTDTGPAGPRLVCAVDRALVEGLTAQVFAANARLVSAQPFLVAAFNRIRGTIGHGSCWLVIEEPGRLTLAFIQRGVWTAIRSRRADARWRERLPEIIEREGAFLALNEPCTRVIVCAQGAFDTQMYEAFRTQAVDYRELALAWE